MWSHLIINTLQHHVHFGKLSLCLDLIQPQRIKIQAEFTFCSIEMLPLMSILADIERDIVRIDWDRHLPMPNFLPRSSCGVFLWI